MSVLGRTRLFYEEVPASGKTSSLRMKLANKFVGFKVKKIKDGYVAQVKARIVSGEARKEIAEIGTTEQAALEKLETRLVGEGLLK